MNNTQEINFFDCSRSNEDSEKLLELFQSGNIASGKEVSILENNLKDYFQCDDAITFSDMTSAIFSLFKAIEIGQDDEVLCSSYNCLSSTSAISLVGAKAVWVDLCNDYPSMSIEDCKSKITSKTKAILLYHIAGYPSDIEEFRTLCEDRDIILIEDLNNSFGATWNSKLVGSVGDFTILSFYPNRQISSIEGAAILVKNKASSNRLKALRKYGIEQDSFRNSIGEINPDSDVKKSSFNFSLSNVNACLVNQSIKNHSQRINSVIQNAAFLNKELCESDKISIVKVPDNIKPVYWGFFIKVLNSTEIIKSLKNEKIHATKLHFPNHHYSIFKSSKPSEGSLINTQKFYNEVICLPCGWWLDINDMTRVVHVMKKLITSIN